MIKKKVKAKKVLRRNPYLQSQVMICGCQHKTACGLVREIRKQINETDFIAIEDFYGKTVYVHLESDGGLWEISYGYSDD